MQANAQEETIMVATRCAVCQDRLSLKRTNQNGWWHLQQQRGSNKNNNSNAANRPADLCTEHYWKLPRGERKKYRQVVASHDLGNEEEQAAYLLTRGATTADSVQWWWGRTGRSDGGVGATMTRVAVLCGGGWFERPQIGTKDEENEEAGASAGATGGGPIQACDKDSVAKITETLEEAGSQVVQLDVDELGSDGEEDDRGATARRILASCRACVVPGGHDVAQAASLGIRGKGALETFVQSGGGLVGICGGAWLLCHGDSQLEHNFGWLPVVCDPDFGDNGLQAMVQVDATQQGVRLLGEGLAGTVYFDESPRMTLLSSSSSTTNNEAGREEGMARLKILATYGRDVSAASFSGAAALERMGQEAVQSTLAGSAAVVSGNYQGGSQAAGLPSPTSAGRMVLLGPHWEVTRGPPTKGQVVARAVAWAAGKDLSK